MIAEVLAKGKVIGEVIQKHMEQIVIESDSVVTVKTTNEEINLSRLIENIVENINIMTKKIKNIKFVYYSRLTDILINMLVKMVHSLVLFIIFLIKKNQWNGNFLVVDSYTSFPKKDWREFKL